MTVPPLPRRSPPHHPGTRASGRRLAGARVIAGAAGSALLALAAPPATADWLERFDGGLSNDWIFAATDDGGAPPSTGVSTFAVVEAGPDDYLLIAHSTTALPDGGGGASDAFGYVDESFTNLAISADVNAGPALGQQSVLAVLGRGNPATGSSYLAAVDFAASRFAIARSDDFLDFQTPLVVDDSLSIDRGRTYRIQFFLVGTTLTARLLDASTRALLSTIHVTDSSYASGGAGILVETRYQAGVPVGPIVGTFDDVEAVPEPAGATALAMATALLGALAAGRRRRSAVRR
ncbi:MAG: hypothetical protein U0900_07310 [Myxococcota bacterium]